MEERPFSFGSAVTGENFTDREKETKRLGANFKHGINTILISPRRWGKTSLVKKTIELVKSEKLKIVYLDIFACRTPEEFLTRFAENVVKQTSSRTEEWFENIKSFLLRFNPKFTMRPDLLTEYSLNLQFSPLQEDREEILNLPEKIAIKKNCRVVVCIDEFQQIGEFKNSLTFQKQLRTVWQHQQSTSYCLFGSKKHLMMQLFENTDYPFYKFGDLMFLNKIPSEMWTKFIIERFNDSGKNIDASIAEEISTLVECQSNYVQQLAWILWVNTNREATHEELKFSFNELIQHNSPLFERMIENLTGYQLNFLRAVVSGVKKDLTSQENLIKYQLGTSANVSRIKESLLNKDLIEINNKETTIPDPIFREWLRRELKIS